MVALTDVATKYSPSILYLANPDNPTGSYFGYNSIGDLLDRPEKASVVRTFVGSLFLAREGRIDIIQKNLESHSIYVKNLESAG